MLIHLTRHAETMTAILEDGQVRAKNPFGAAFNVDALAFSQTVACFSEMAALDSVATLADRHGEYGIGFAKAWMHTQGAAPVWYVPRDSSVQTELFNTVRELAFRTRPDPSHPLWRITPFVDYPREVQAGEVAAPYDWRWEREWRIRGGLHFQADDIALLFAPESQHARVIEAWKREMIEGWGGYMPPLIDTRWPRDQQKAVIRRGPVVVEVEFLEWTDSWIDDAETAPSGDFAAARDDEHRERQAELREELNDWLDEMARDDI